MLIVVVCTTHGSYHLIKRQTKVSVYVQTPARRLPCLHAECSQQYSYRFTSLTDISDTSSFNSVWAHFMVTK